jgi:23S rRNA pseudouridine1911/1915/1917 synthase
LSIGNPILGDQDYGIEPLVLKGKGLYLHASQLDFTHPFTKEKLSIKSNLPKKFKMIC